jgi:hypothetical protein
MIGVRCPRCRGWVYWEREVGQRSLVGSAPLVQTCLACGWYQQPEPLPGLAEPRGYRRRMVRPPDEPDDAGTAPL